MLDSYPRFAIFIGLILMVFQAIYATAVGIWLVLQFGVPVTSGFLIFIMGFVFLEFMGKMAIEAIKLIYTLFLIYRS